MKQLIIILLALWSFSSCDQRSAMSDAYGNFEVEDVIVSAESSGRLLEFTANQGQKVDPHQALGLIDTTSVALQIKQLDAQVLAVQSGKQGVRAQVDAQNQSLANANVVYDRIKKLLDSGAATQQQMDEIEGQLKLLEKQIKASKTQLITIDKEVAVLMAQKALLQEQLKRCTIVSPLFGVVLEKYVQEGEMVAAGKPLVKVADLSILDLKCYLPGDKLEQLKLGQRVQVLIDSEEGSMKELEGTVTWISNQAEFTPKIIQTKEERVKLVYAVKVMVENDGSLKVGMPGEMNIQPVAIQN